MRLIAAGLLLAGVIGVSGCGKCTDCTPPTAPTAPTTAGSNHAGTSYFLCVGTPSNAGGGSGKVPCPVGSPNRYDLGTASSQIQTRNVILELTKGAGVAFDLWAHHAGQAGWRIEGTWYDNLKLSANPPLRADFAFGLDQKNGPQDEWLAGSEDRVPTSGTPQDLAFVATEFSRQCESCLPMGVNTRVAIRLK